VPGRRTGRLITATVFACLPLAALAAPAAANGIGDVYVATAREVLEIRVDQVRVVNTVDVPPVSTALAFSNDGRDLYVAANRQEVALIDIETISPAAPLEFTRPVAALAVPLGKLVVAAMPDTRTVAAMDPASGSVVSTAVVPGAVDLLASSRRDRNVVAAESGARWLASVDPADGTVQSTELPGVVAALAVDRTPGTAWVVTRSPNQLLHVSLPDLRVLAQIDVPDRPVAVASMLAGVVVATDRALLRLEAQQLATWGKPGHSIVAIAASDDGKVLVAGETDQVEAFSADGRRARQLQLSGTRSPLALAPIPGPSSLAGGTGLGFTSGSDASATGRPASSHMPVTATADGNGWVPGRAPVAGAAIVAAAILGAYWMVLRAHAGREERRKARAAARLRRS